MLKAILFNQVQGKMKRISKNRASLPKYVNNNQLTITGFESPFDKKLNTENRWVKLSNALPISLSFSTCMSNKKQCTQIKPIVLKTESLTFISLM